MVAEAPERPHEVAHALGIQLQDPTPRVPDAPDAQGQHDGLEAGVPLEASGGLAGLHGAPPGGRPLGGALCEPDERDGKLIGLLGKYHKSRKNRILIFVLYKKEAARVEQFLNRKGFPCVAVHGDMGQRDRENSVKQFHAGKVPLLVATDVAARGLDIPDVEYVMNYSFPLTVEDYVHRIGRTGRAGRKGASFTLVAPKDAKFVDAIEKLIDRKIEYADGDLSTIAADDEGEKPAARTRKGRSRKPDSKPVEEKAEAARPTEAEKPAPANKAAPSQASRPAPPQDKRPANDDRRRPRRRDRDDDHTPVGFGDEIPAFMLVAAKA